MPRQTSAPRPKDPTGRTVTVLAGMPADQTAKTLAHEAAHAVADHDRHHIEREDAEAVAECAAHLVCAHHGIDTGAHTFTYVAGWARDRDRFRRNLGAARETANAIIDGLADVTGPVAALNRLGVPRHGPAC